jgi:hypothetical protein
VYADWLEEHSDVARAEFIRVQVELARLPERDERRQALEANEGELLDEYEEAWLKPFGIIEMSAEFRRGFVWGVTADADDFIERAEQWFQLAPVQHADLGADIKGLRALARSPWLGRLTSLRLGSDLQAADIRAFAGSTFLAHLASLDLYNNSIRDGGLRALAAAPHLGNLKEVRLGWNGIGSAGLTALANSPVLGHLTHLDLFYNEVDGRGAEALAASHFAAALRYLNFRGNDIDNEGGRALAESPYLTGLSRLDLHQNRVTEATRELLRARFGNRVQF